jgi:hypothetical protein
MSIYLSDQERELIKKHRSSAPLNRFYWALLRRVTERAATPGLLGMETTVEWWHAAEEYVSDAAMIYAIQPDDTIGRWLRDVTLSITRRSADDWAGPWFRDHDTQPLQGHLETAHLSVAVAAALDLAADLFTAAERDEIRTVLREIAIPQCTRWLDRARHFNNWRCVLMSGLAAAAAVTGDKDAIERAVAEVNTCCQAFYADGSHSESLQYSGYASFSLMVAYESLVRYDAALAQRISPRAYGKAVRWIAHSFFYLKPLTGWGEYPRPRSANFNDSTAMYRPSGDWLMHVATRLRTEMPAEAGLARWLFDLLYAPGVARTPNDRATFGFINDFGFLTLPLLPQAAAAIAPQDAGLGAVARYDNGDAFARQAWDSRTILAMRTASDPMPGPSHLHGDINSFILVHNKERLLLDAGHSCYRNLIRELDVSSISHNTCTFMAESEAGIRRAEDVEAAVTLVQKTGVHRTIRDGQLGPLVERGGRFLLAAEQGPVKVIASDAAGLYSAPIQSFTRFCFLLGEHVIFIVDRITASKPVRTTWNWLLNNRDGGLDLKIVRPDRLVARRGDAGMKLFHLGGGAMSGPVYAYVHDAYHPLPNQTSEGKPGSGMLMRWSERTAQTERTVIHAIAVDDYGTVAGWHLRTSEQGAGLEGPAGSPAWFVETTNNPFTMTVREKTTGATYRVVGPDGVWTLTKIE